MSSLIKLSAIITTLLISANSLAIDVDRTQPIEIESDSAVIDDSQGLSTYRGNVVISQGTTELRADSITVFAKERRVSQIVATGAPARFYQQDIGAEQGTSGKAEQITYDAKESILIFDGSAELSQSTNAFSGDKIEYDIMRKAIRAKGDENKGKRVKIQYFPSAIDSPETTDQTTEATDR